MTPFSPLPIEDGNDKWHDYDDEESSRIVGVWQMTLQKSTMTLEFDSNKDDK